jgi:NAD(P)-dependent dehydrogenase (short-subunit alcohol dehydrogenase family)
MSVALITGAATGIGNLTAMALAGAGHTVYASMRDPDGHNAGHARELREQAQADRRDLRIVELDVQSQVSAEQAVATILDDAGRLDVVVQNAGHLDVGYVEAFSAEEIAQLFDINVLGAHRVNRAALPHMRVRGSGTLLYVGSTTSVSVAPFLGPYVTSTFAFDALAMVTSYEVSQFGIETTIVMPGAFTQGTEHFPSATRASDDAVTAAYAKLDPLVARNEAATARARRLRRRRGPSRRGRGDHADPRPSARGEAVSQRCRLHPIRRRRGDRRHRALPSRLRHTDGIRRAARAPSPAAMTRFSLVPRLECAP